MTLPGGRRRGAYARFAVALGLAAVASSVAADVQPIAAGEVRSHRFAVPRGQVRSVLVESRHVGLSATVVAPDGTRTTLRTMPAGTLLPIVLLGSGDGEHTLEVTSAGSGSYSLRSEPPAPARSADERRVQAQALSAEGARLAEAPGNDARTEAVQRFEEARALSREAGDRPAEASALQAQAEVHQALGDHARSVAAEREAVEIWRELGETRAEAVALHRLAHLLTFLGELDEGTRLLARSAQLWRDLQDPEGEGNALYESSLYLFSLGRHEEALASASEAVTLLAGTDAAHFHGEAINLMARAHARLGDVEEAVRLHEEALEAFSARGDALGQAQTHNYIAQLQIALGQDAAAMKHAQRSLSMARRAANQHWQAFAQISVSQAARALGRHAEAMSAAEAALSLWRGVNVRWSQGMAMAEMGAVHAAQGRHRRALDLFDSALSIARPLNDRPRLAQALEYASRSWLALGEPDRALEALEEARDIWRQLVNGWREVTVMAALAQAQFDLGRLGPARATLDVALSRLEALRGRIPGDVMRSAYFASVRSVYDLQMLVLWRLHEAAPDAGHDAEALAVSERARARSLLDLLTEKKMEVRQGIAPALRDREREVHGRMASIQRQIAAALAQPRSARVAALESQLAVAENERQAVELEIRRLHPRYAALRYPQPVRPDQVQPVLDADSALLEYAVGSQGSHLFVVTRERRSWYRLPPAPRLEELVRRVRGVLARPTRLRGSYVRDARELFQSLVAPAEEDLAGKRHLIIVPDGALHELPFEVLLTAEPGAGGYSSLPYLVRRWSVSTAPSASVLLELSGRPPATGDGTMMAFGNPYRAAGPRHSSPAALARLTRSVLSEGGAAALAGLPGAEREVRSIARLFPPSQVTVRLGRAATEEAVKTEAAARAARFLHFATHALVSEQDPQHSGLVMAWEPSSREDGLLQVYEIFDLDLSADMVVLSACQTGSGRLLRGEGIVGLSRAFFHAGARTLVASLWPVADASTADLMTAFYEGMRSDDRADALRAAKLALIASPRFSHPHHWAAFVMMGASR